MMRRASKPTKKTWFGYRIQIKKPARFLDDRAGFSRFFAHLMKNYA
jgi:hypothetical protein